LLALIYQTRTHMPKNSLIYRGGPSTLTLPT